MLKRVNIQYSIDLDELPNEVDRIYTNAKDIFSSLSLPEESGDEILSADVLKKNRPNTQRTNKSGSHLKRCYRYR